MSWDGKHDYLHSNTDLVTLLEFETIDTDVVRFCHRLPQPTVRSPMPFHRWKSLTKNSIVGSGLVDQAILIDQTGQSVWGKASDVEVHSS